MQEPTDSKAVLVNNPVVVTDDKGNTSQSSQNNVATDTTAPVILASREAKADPQPQTASDNVVNPETVNALSKTAPAVGEVQQPVEIVENKPKHSGGRPTKYNVNMYKKAKAYFDECFQGVRDVSGKIIRQPRVPYIEELELMLDIDDDTINEWAKDNNKKEFSATYYKLKKLQKLRLKQMLVRGKTNPLGPKFLLEAEHGLMATEKQIQETDRSINVNITREAIQ